MSKTKQRLQKALQVQIIAAVCLFLLFACTSPQAVPETSEAPYRIKSILILPIRDISAVYGANKSIRCPVCGKVITTGDVSSGAAEFINGNLFSYLEDNREFKLIPPGQAQGVLSGLLSDDETNLSERDLLLETGRALKADAVLAAYLYRFRERLGSSYSVTSPASVAFDIHLIRLIDGRVVWSGHFDETQKALSEDLYQLETFIKRKASWITAREMAQAGLEDLLKTFPGSSSPISDQESR
jgi:hypothetical protein